MFVYTLIVLCYSETQVLITNDARKVDYVMRDPANTRINVVSVMPKIELVVESANMTGLSSVNGSAVYFYNTYWIDPILKTNFSNFRNMVASANGGAIYYGNSKTMTIDQTNFTSNQAVKGGGAYLELAINVSVTDSVFNRNQGQYGGGLHITNVKTADVANNKFINNIATSGGGGGGMYSEIVLDRLSIRGCLFEGCTSPSSSGGAIYLVLNTGFTELLDCIFYNCTAQSYGAIYITSNTPNSIIVLKNICGFNCSATSSVHFMQIGLLSNSDFISTIYLNYTSISQCSWTTIKSVNSRLYYGNIRVQNCNISNNKAQRYSGFYVSPTYESQISYSTIANNQESEFNVIFIDGSYGLMNYIKYCNVLWNNSPTDTYGIINLNGKASSANGTQISYTIFFGNNNSLVSLQTGGSHSMVNCHIVHNLLSYSLTRISAGSLSTGGIVSDITGTPTYTLEHLSTFYCPSGGHLIPFEDTPCQTIPPLPSTCGIETQGAPDPSLGLSAILHFLFSSIMSSFIFG